MDWRTSTIIGMSTMVGEASVVNLRTLNNALSTIQATQSTLATISTLSAMLRTDYTSVYQSTVTALGPIPSSNASMNTTIWPAMPAGMGNSNFYPNYPYLY